MGIQLTSRFRKSRPFEKWAAVQMAQETNFTRRTRRVKDLSGFFGKIYSGFLENGMKVSKIPPITRIQNMC